MKIKVGYYVKHRTLRLWHLFTGLWPQRNSEMQSTGASKSLTSQARAVDKAKEQDIIKSSSKITLEGDFF